MSGTILLIEDTIREMRQRVEDLKERFPQYKIRAEINCEDGCKAIAEDSSIVAVISDNSMPLSDKDSITDLRSCALTVGTAVNQRNKERGETIPFYVFSGEISPTDRTELENMGAYIANKKESFDFYQLMDDLAQKLAQPRRLPVDHREPGTRGSGKAELG